MDKFLTNYKPNNTNGNENKIQKKKLIPWVEKYRPNTIDEVVHQEEVVTMLKKCINGADFPNLLFYGPPGTGKTSTILAAAKDLFGSEIYKERVLELNSSDERGISVIRDKVKLFASNSASEKINARTGKKIPGFKLIILDECDSMTSVAQSALRRVMEVYCKSTRFCLICNYVSRIIDPLTSRCVKFRFKPLNRDSAINRLSNISESEKIKASTETLLKLLELSEGDLRRAITMLQTATSMSLDGEVTEGLIIEISGTIPETVTEQFITAVRSNSFEQVQSSVKAILMSAYAARQFIKQLLHIVLNMDVNDTTKALFLQKIARCESQLMIGADEELQLMAVGCFMLKMFNEAR